MKFYVEPITAALDNLPNLSDFTDLGLFGALGFAVFRYFSAHTDRTTNESWELLEELVRSLRESNATLTQTNHELVIQLRELSHLS